MSKRLRKILILSIIMLFIFLKSIYATYVEKKTVTSWKELKEVIENSTFSEIEVQLSGSSWTADSTITISENKKVTINATSSITIKKNNTLKTSLITNCGTLNMKTSSSNVKIFLDGNKSNIQSTRSLIRVENGNINLNNIVLQNNENQYAGGGLTVVTQADNSTINIDNVAFQNNEASLGGGIYIGSETCKTKLNNVIINSNKAISGNGGGIYTKGTSLTISGINTSISNNTAQTYGGGIFAKNKIIINDGVISNNKASESGGGVRIRGTLVLNKCTINNNSTDGNGGGIDFDGSWFDPINVIQNKSVTIEDNTAKEGNNTYPDLSLYNDWSTDQTLKFKKVSMQLVSSYDRGTDLADFASQGMAIGEKYIICAQCLSDDENTYINIIDKNTYKILNVDKTYCFSHANGITYNKAEDRYYISYHLSQTENYISSFKINNSYKISDLRTTKVDRYYCGIAYDEDHNYFIGVNANKMYIMDKDFKVLRSFVAKTNLTKQDIAYFGNHIYYGCFESGHMNGYQQYYNSKERHSNLIYVYDLKGNLEKTIHISYTSVIGELESLHVNEDGIMVSYNIGTSKISFYKVSSDEVFPKLTIKYSTTTQTNQNVTVTITSNEKVQSVLGWTLSSDGKKLTKTYTANTTEKVIVKDLAGNEKEIEITISNIVNIGDINENNEIDIGDIILLLRHLAQENSNDVKKEHSEWKLNELKEEIGDLNKNSKIDIGDIIKLLRYIAAKNSEEIVKEHPEWLNLKKM